MKDKISLSFIEKKDRFISEYSEKKSGKDYVSYGDFNDFPEYIWELYLKSSILQSICNGTSDFISGNGIDNILIPFLQGDVNSNDEGLEDVLRKISLDYQIFGGFAMNIVYDYDGNVKEIYELDIRNVRLNEDGDRAFYSNKWNKYGCKALEYPVWTPELDKRNLSCVFYFKGHISRGLYPIPRYNGALSAIETSTEISKFHLNNILNNFVPSAVVSFNNGQPSEEEKENIRKQLKERFTGASAAGEFLVCFNDDKEHSVEITRLSEDKMDEKFQTLSKSIFQEIFIAFRACPAIFGMNPENNGFSKQEFLESFELYNKTCIVPAQKDIIRCFEKIFGVDNVFTFKPFILNAE